MFGSRVQSILTEAGFDVTLCGSVDQLTYAAAGGCDVVVVDFAASPELVEQLPELSAAGVCGELPVLAIYSHVDTDTQQRLKQAGIELVVPRSRFMREGGELAMQLAAR